MPTWELDRSALLELITDLSEMVFFDWKMDGLKGKQTHSNPYKGIRATFAFQLAF